MLFSCPPRDPDTFPNKHFSQFMFSRWRKALFLGGGGSIESLAYSEKDSAKSRGWIIKKGKNQKGGLVRMVRNDPTPCLLLCRRSI